MNVLTNYIKNNKNQKVGFVVAKLDEEGKIIYGWSLCNKRDKFNRERGLEIALGRMDKKPSWLSAPYSVVPHLWKMMDRAKRYYKVESL